MTYKFENKELKIGEISLEFDDEIKEVIDFSGFLVVRTNYYESTTNENVYGINTDGKKNGRLIQIQLNIKHFQ